MEDQELLRAYAETGSEEAFQELASRYAGLVYSVALRQVVDSYLAEDVCQSVFCLLARKAGSISPNSILAGWLHRAACNIASDVRRAEQCRRAREQKASLMEADESGPDREWEQMAPLLDQAIQQLGEKDRQVLLLRFFQRQPMQEVGKVLGMSEDAAKMRVSRALEKLRGIFARRGLIYSCGGLGMILYERSVRACPAGVEKAIGITALAQAGSGGAAVSASMKLLLLMAKLKTRTGIVAGVAALLLLIMTAVIYTQKYHDSLRERISGVNPSKNAVESVAEIAGGSNVTNTSNSADASLNEAIAGLRKALYDPFRSRRLPADRVIAALAKFGANRRAAIPTLMEALKLIHRGHASYLASYGIIDLGEEAAEVLPELLKLFYAGELGTDQTPKMFLAVHPHADLIPQLLPALQLERLGLWNMTSILIADLAKRDPMHAEPYRLDLLNMLEREDYLSRFSAALTLARYPGPLEARVVPVLQEGLKASELAESHFYDSTADKVPNKTHKFNDEKSQDIWSRKAAATALDILGSAAKAALPELQIVAEKTEDASLRETALLAIGHIDPDRRAENSEIDQITTAYDQGTALVGKIKAGTADDADLVEALKYQLSVSEAARSLIRQEPEKLKAILPALRVAFEKFGDFDIAQIIKQQDPTWLAEALNQWGAMNQAADSLGELGSAARFALPGLWNALENGPKGMNREIVGRSIREIDPQGPKPIFRYEDLSPAVNALVQAAEEKGGRVNGRIATIQLQVENWNSVTRGELKKFAEAVREADPEMHRIFVAKLVESNPALNGWLSNGQGQ